MVDAASESEESESEEEDEEEESSKGMGDATRPPSDPIPFAGPLMVVPTVPTGKAGPPCPGAVDLGRIDPATWIMGAPNPKSIWSGCVSCGVCACVRACVCKSLAFISSSIHQQEAVCKHACDSRLLNVFAWLQYYHPV